VKCDSVEKRRSYRLFNIAAYRFFSVINVQAEMLFNFQKPVTRLLQMMMMMIDDDDERMNFNVA